MDNNNFLNRKILNCLETVLCKYFEFTYFISEEYINTPLTAPPFRLSGADLYRVLMYIENEFNIRLSPKDIRENSFKTPADIIKLVKLHLNYKDEYKEVII
nr:hypothetical protein [Clostridium paraputrificum]